jgi:hypothetical protein
MALPTMGTPQSLQAIVVVMENVWCARLRNGIPAVGFDRIRVPRGTPAFGMAHPGAAMAFRALSMGRPRAAKACCDRFWGQCR